MVQTICFDVTDTSQVHRTGNPKFVVRFMIYVTGYEKHIIDAKLAAIQNSRIAEP